MVSHEQPVAHPRRQLGRPFADQNPTGQAIVAVVIPAVLGGVAGWVLGHSAAGYWAISVIATIGGFLAGTEHPSARSGALRGLVGGTTYGALILLVHQATGDVARVSLGSVPAFLVVITAAAGAALGALGGRRNGRAVAAHRP